MVDRVNARARLSTAGNSENCLHLIGFVRILFESFWKVVESIKRWLSSGGYCGPETYGQGCARHWIDGRHWICDCQVACERRCACISERAHTRARGSSG